MFISLIQILRVHETPRILIGVFCVKIKCKTKYVIPLNIVSMRLTKLLQFIWNAV